MDVVQSWDLVIEKSCYWSYRTAFVEVRGTVYGFSIFGAGSAIWGYCYGFWFHRIRVGRNRG